MFAFSMVDRSKLVSLANGYPISQRIWAPSIGKKRWYSQSENGGDDRQSDCPGHQTLI